MEKILKATGVPLHSLIDPKKAENEQSKWDVLLGFLSIQELIFIAQKFEIQFIDDPHFTKNVEYSDRLELIFAIIPEAENNPSFFTLFWKNYVRNLKTCPNLIWPNWTEAAYMDVLRNI